MRSGEPTRSARGTCETPVARPWPITASSEAPDHSLRDHAVAEGEGADTDVEDEDEDEDGVGADDGTERDKLEGEESAFLAEVGTACRCQFFSILARHRGENTGPV